MPKYSYKALNNKGRPVRGNLNAANEKDLFQQLQDNGFELIDCKAQSDKKSKLAVFGGKIELRDMVQMFVHLEQLQKAGVPLLDGLSDIRDSTESSRLRDVMTEVYKDVSEGSSLSQAVSKHPRVFEEIFVSLIGAGEETGNLTKSFEQLIHHLKWTDAMNTKVKKATRYPKILCGVILVVMYVMLGLVVPDVIGFLENIGQELPGVTLALIATSEFFQDYFLYIAAALGAFIMILKMGRASSENFRYKTDYIALRMPVMGPLIRKISLSRFCQTFGVLFSSGLEILRCLDSAADTAGNLVIKDALFFVKEQVQEGAPLSEAISNTGEFPSLVVRMVKIGEESGNLTGVLEQVSEFYDKDVNEAVDAMVTMIEPALTAILGGIMLWIAAAVFGPVYDSFSNMGV